MPLPTRSLGTSGLQITTVGFGSWAVGGGGYAFGWGPQDDRQSQDAIAHAVELGVNWVDTAAIYGVGHSEEVVGRAVRALPEAARPLVFTKCGLEWDPAEPSKEWRECTPATVRRGAEDSLRRLGLDRIDLFQIHWPDDRGNPIEAAWEEMLKLKEEGLVGAVGVSNFEVELLERCEALGHVDSLQPPFSLIARDTAADLLPWAAAHGTGVICYSPMKNGLLTDSFGVERLARMAEDDWRRSAPSFQEPALSRNLALRDALRPVAERHGATVAAVAIAWVLSWPGVSGAIVGGRAPEQVDGWVGAAGLTLSAADLDEIAAAVEATGAGSGPADPPSIQVLGQMPLA
jgi:aryl-alcohol dehydrogenase-like predicted oxidoreductase